MLSNTTPHNGPPWPGSMHPVPSWGLGNACHVTYLEQRCSTRHECGRSRLVKKERRQPGLLPLALRLVSLLLERWSLGGDTSVSSFAVLAFCFLVALVSGNPFLRLMGPVAHFWWKWRVFCTREQVWSPWLACALSHNSLDHGGCVYFPWAPS